MTEIDGQLGILSMATKLSENSKPQTSLGDSIPEMKPATGQNNSMDELSHLEQMLEQMQTRRRNLGDYNADSQDIRAIIGALLVLLRRGK